MEIIVVVLVVIIVVMIAAMIGMYSTVTVMSGQLNRLRDDHDRLHLQFFDVILNEPSSTIHEHSIQQRRYFCG